MKYFLLAMLIAAPCYADELKSPEGRKDRMSGIYAECGKPLKEEYNCIIRMAGGKIKAISTHTDNGEIYIIVDLKTEK